MQVNLVKEVNIDYICHIETNEPSGNMNLVNVSLLKTVKLIVSRAKS